jgi:Raf kinase inhibitor-like YbhB/YbcL family protein
MSARFVKLLTVVVMGMFVASLSAQQPQGGAPQGAGQGQGGGRGGGRGRGGPGMALTSTSWADGAEIPAKYAGQMGVSPQLSWTNVPMGTVEFVLLMHDPEPVVPAGSVSGDILHWLVVKIPATTTSLPEGAGAAQSTLLPEGARQVQAFRGPGAPAAGPRHHYTLILYALNAALDLPATADRAAVVAAMEGKVIGRAVFGGRFMQAPPPPAQ